MEGLIFFGALLLMFPLAFGLMEWFMFFTGDDDGYA